MVICPLSLLNGTFLCTIWKIWTYEAAKLFIQELHAWENLAYGSLGGGLQKSDFFHRQLCIKKCLTVPHKHACPNDYWTVT
jgi:hypothetical protein